MFCIRKSTPAQGRETKESGPFAKPPDLECSSGVRCLGEERLQSKKSGSQAAALHKRPEEYL